MTGLAINVFKVFGLAAVVLPLMHADLALADPVLAKIRELQRTQDKLVAGDRSSMAKQMALLAEADKLLAGDGSVDGTDPARGQAIIAYALSGGNPRTVERAFITLPDDAPEKALAKSLAAYMQGDKEQTQAQLAEVDPLTVRPEFGGPLAIIRANLLAEERPEDALRVFDEARLLAPGTLVEDSSLRRSLALSLRLEDREAFLRYARQYAVRYLRSPYAAQYADLLAGGFVKLFAAADFGKLAEITATMPEHYRQAIYLRGAREAAINGKPQLVNQMTEAITGGIVKTSKDQELQGLDDLVKNRIALYGALADMLSERPEDAMTQLEKVDPSILDEDDRSLLEAGKALTSGLAMPQIDKELKVSSHQGAASKSAPVEMPAASENSGMHPKSAEAGEIAKSEDAVGQEPPADNFPALDETMTSAENAVKRVDALLKELQK